MCEIAMGVHELRRFWNTVRYLKPSQLGYRLRRRWIRPRADLRPPPELRQARAPWRPPAARPPCLVGRARFRLHGHDLTLTGPLDWHNQRLPALAIYHLHYFDDLCAHQAPTRRHWHQQLIDQWIRENPPATGPGWDPYPTSLRIVNWIKWALAGNPLTNSAVHSLAIQARRLSQTLEFDLLANHLLANAKALVFVGTFFAGPEPDAWTAAGMAVLDRQLPEQVLPDGGHFELSPMYHSIILEDLLDMVNLAESYTTDALRARVGYWKQVANRMRAWLQVMCHPDGEISFFSDATFQHAAAPDQLEHYAVRLGFHPLPSLADGLIALPDSGYVRLQYPDAVLLIDVARVGPDYQPGHAHADTLSFEMSLGGLRMLVNSGVSSYEAGCERLSQRGTAAHNALVVDEVDSSEVWGSFRVARRARPFDLVLEPASDGAYVACSHDGYRRLAGRVVHRRSWNLTGQKLDVCDRLEGRFRSAAAYFHLHPQVLELSRGEAESFRWQLAGRNVVLQTRGAQAGLVRSTYHPAFGIAQPNHVLHCTLAGPTAEYQLRW